MSKKRIISIIMLIVLAAGIGLAVYGATGTAVYDNAAAMLGGDKKAAIGYIQNPSSLKEISSLEKLGTDKVKSFLKGLGLDAAAVDRAWMSGPGMRRRSPTARTARNSSHTRRAWTRRSQQTT